MIKFEDFFTVDEPGKTKVKFNVQGMNARKTPCRAFDLLMDGEENPAWIEMNAFKTKHANNNLNKFDYLLAFAQYCPYGSQYYIFGGMYRIEKIIPEVFDQRGYILTLMNEFADYRKRLIIKLSKPIGWNKIYNKAFIKVQQDFNPEVFELTPSIRQGTFPGYNSVLLTHKELQAIFRMEVPDWKTALSNVKGIYCITDTSTGKLYIGSASGMGGIWQRWASYADVSNLTGGNKTFEELKDYSTGYIIDNFTYSILEIFDMRTKRDYIIDREEFWKRVFKTVKYGMNN